VVNEAAAVAANTAEGADLVTRPMFDGVTEFQAIRGPEAPETYSWTVDLAEGQTLEMAGENVAEVYCEDGTPAMSIMPQPAHDATGKNVNTSITVSEGDVLTLTVHHREAGVVYPVIGGANFETGYESLTIYTPPPPPPPKEEYWESGDLIVGPPESTEASASSSGSGGGEMRKQFVRVICRHSTAYPEELSADESFREDCGNPFLQQPGYATPWQAAMRGAFHYKPSAWAEQRGAKACAGATYDTSDIAYYVVKEAYQCHYGPRTADGNGGVKVSGGNYLRAQAHWELGSFPKCVPSGECSSPTIWEDKALELHLALRGCRSGRSVEQAREQYGQARAGGNGNETARSSGARVDGSIVDGSMDLRFRRVGPLRDAVLHVRRKGRLGSGGVVGQR
jgi:hypothetical protein